MTAPPSSPAIVIAEGMDRFRREMEANDRVSLEITAKTKRIIKWVSLFLVALTAAVLAQIWTMRSDLMDMVEILQDMYLRFDVIAANLDAMTTQVGAIGHRVAGFPSVAADMTAINTDVKDIRWSMGTITSDVTTMTTDMTRLRDTTGEMTRHFYDVQQTVGGLNYNIEQMLRPLSIVPR